MNLNTRKASPVVLLLITLICITLYRIWIIPRLGVTLYVDEAQYWTWAKELNFGGYYSKPPMIAWLIAATTAVLGDGLIGVKLCGLLLYPATTCIVYALGTRLFDQQIGLRSAIAFILLPFVALFNLLASTDAPLLFFWAASMLFLLRALETNRWRDWLGLGACFGLGLMSKYTMGAISLSVLPYLLCERSRRGQLLNPRLWVAVLLATVIFLPNVLWNWQHDFPTLRHTANIMHIDGTEGNSGRSFGEFLLSQFGALGPGMVVALFGGLWLGFKQWRDRQNQSRMQFLLCFTVPLFVIVFVQAARSDVNGNWDAPAFIGATILATYWLSRQKLRWWLLTLAANVLIMIGGYHMSTFYNLIGHQITAATDPAKRAKGWDTLGEKAAVWFKKYPDAMLLTDNRTIMANMRYNARDAITTYAEYAPFPRADDHYQLVVPLTVKDHGNRRAILMLERRDHSAISREFEKFQELDYIEVEVEPGLKRESGIVLVENFKGYLPR